MKKPIQTDYLRSTLFGLEDGLVSTTGAVVGIAVGAQDARVVILAGLVIIAVEAISMGAGQFLSEQAVHEIEKHRHQDSLLGGSLLMFVSYFLAGLIPVLPFVFLPLKTASFVALAAALMSLFMLGYIKAKFTKVNAIKSGLQILAIGGIATVIGVVVGVLLRVN